MEDIIHLKYNTDVNFILVRFSPTNDALWLIIVTSLPKAEIMKIIELINHMVLNSEV